MPLTLKHRALLAASSLSGLHYDLRIKGALPRDLGGCLFVVLNHTALSDPFLVSRAIGLQGFNARFVTHTAMYHRNKWLMDQMGALPVPSTFDGKGDWTQERIRRSIETVHQALARGEKVGIYPSGQLKAGDAESLGGKTMVFDLLSRHPETPVVIIEVKGLLYTLTSRYFTGGVQSPNRDHMFEIMRRAPVRFATERVPVEVIFHAPAVLPQFPTARALNEHLEAVANATPDYGPTWRAALRTDADTARYRFTRTAEAVATTALDPDVTTAVVSYLATLPEVAAQGIAATAIGPNLNLISDLGLDSLAEVALRLWAEDTFPVVIDPDVQIMTVRDLIVACQGALAEVDGNGASGGTERLAPRGWIEHDRRDPAFPGGETLAHAILRQCHGQGLSKLYTYDATATDLLRPAKKKPLVTYRDMLVRAIVLARVLQREYPEEKHIGCLLPAAAGTATFALGALIAGKVLVPLNWTNGKAALDASIATAGLNVIFTSEQFLEKAAIPLSPLAISKIALAENVRKKAGVRDLFAAVRLAGRSPEAVLRAFANGAKGDDIAAILFTSGSESTPKDVPLSHRNILSNVAGSLAVIGGKSSDVMLAFLPPFHSFGLVQLMMLSLIGGVKVVYAPDPRKFKQLKGVAERFGATIIAGTPDFLGGILDAANGCEPGLAGVRLWLSGAQKAPAALRARVQAMGSALIEGYGITETAPLVTLNRPGEPIVGVGKPIAGTALAVVDIATASRAVACGEEGLVLVSGPGVFEGYLGTAADPFVTFEGRRHYNTGDLGFLDAAGNLTISGRLKRFLKPFGEMVNMTAIEDALASAYPAGEAGPQVAIGGVDVEGRRSFIVLYTTRADVTTDVANRVIKAAGLTNLSFVDHIESVGEIPLLGSGKTNHRALRDAKAILADKSQARSGRHDAHTSEGVPHQSASMAREPAHAHV